MLNETYRFPIFETFDNLKCPKIYLKLGPEISLCVILRNLIALMLSICILFETSNSVRYFNSLALSFKVMRRPFWN